MRVWRSGGLATLIATAVVAVGVASSAGATPAPAGEVLLSDVGSGFTATAEVDDGGFVTREFRSRQGTLVLAGTAVDDPPGVRSSIGALAASMGGDTITEPSLELAWWIVEPGTRPGADGTATLLFAGRSHVFLFAAETAGIDPVGLLLELAARQIDAAGGEPAPPVPITEDEAELVAMLPEAPDGFGLVFSGTVTGAKDVAEQDGLDVELVSFLNRRSTNVARAWVDGTGSLAAAVGLTRFPYDIFAAASVQVIADHPDYGVLSTDALADVGDVVAYERSVDGVPEFGMVFRRGDVSVVVTTQYRGDVTRETAAALTAALAQRTSAQLPRGDTAPYEFPAVPSKLAALGFTAAIVTGAALASRAIAFVRARRVRRTWTGIPTDSGPVVEPEPSAAVDLDPDAARLRRAGLTVAGIQLLTVDVGIVALAGDFAWPGVIVAAIALLAGLAFTRWWQRRELALLGAAAPSRAFTLPRPAGMVVGVLALATLGFGVAYLLKGLRYLVLQPTLAQLRWSDWLGVAPRTVGAIFAVAGIVAAAIGAALYRLARALGRGGTRRALAADRRPPALYLRSFEDDRLPLPAISSARRPLFELFSLRGADPFEEAIAWELNTYGPVVAVGRPGRSLVSLGAAREHLPDSTWREQVAQRMDEAGIVAIVTGETEGLAWELGQIVNGGHLGKTFFVFPPVAPQALERRWEHTIAALHAAGQPVGPLPIPIGSIHTMRVDRTGAVWATFATRRDEATYRTAVDHAAGVITSADPATAGAVPRG